MNYVRYFEVGDRHPDSGVEGGLIGLASWISDHPEAHPDAVREIRTYLDWFNQRLPLPPRFNRTRSKGYARRSPKGICWFKGTATTCLQRMEALKAIVEELGYSVGVIWETRVGYVVYEDEFQVVAEPFADTQTS